jgi:hypothetical protein
MKRPSSAAAEAVGAKTHRRRLVVAVVGDGNLDSTAMKPHRVSGDESHKHQLAEEVSMACMQDMLHVGRAH